MNFLNECSGKTDDQVKIMGGQMDVWVNGWIDVWLHFDKKKKFIEKKFVFVFGPLEWPKRLVA